jgi:hypothetical protein
VRRESKTEFQNKKSPNLDSPGLSIRSVIADGTTQMSESEVVAMVFVG